MVDDSTQAIVDSVEKELVTEILDNVEQNRMTTEEAQTVAQEFLSLLPMQDKHDLLEKLRQFSKHHTEGKSLYIKYGGPIEEAERQQKLTLMSQHIQNGQIEHAINVAKGGTPNASGS